MGDDSLPGGSNPRRCSREVHSNSNNISLEVCLCLAICPNVTSLCSSGKIVKIVMGQVCDFDNFDKKQLSSWDNALHFTVARHNLCFYIKYEEDNI